MDTTEYLSEPDSTSGIGLPIGQNPVNPVVPSVSAVKRASKRLLSSDLGPIPSPIGRTFFPHMRALLLMLALPLAAGISHADDAGAAGWMGRIPAETKLSRITLPGTHNSAALHEPLAGTAKCQNLDLTEQLAAGVRYLDLRCRHTGDSFALHHGMVDQRQTFDSAIAGVAAFLKKNPSECVLVSVKEEHTPTGNTRTFEDTFAATVAKTPGLWWPGTAIPTLGEVRGKLVLVRRFPAAKPLGIDASRWPDNTAFQTATLAVQDAYQVSAPDTKWQKIETALTAARGDRDGTRLHLNYASGYQPGAFGLPNITAVSGSINPRLANWFATAPADAYGCVIMDFADAPTCAAIIKSQARR